MVASHDLDNFFEMSPDFCWIGLPEGRIQRLSSALSRALGWGALGDQRRNFLEFISDEDVTTTKDALLSIPPGPNTLEFVARLRQLDGSYQAVRWMGMRDAGSGHIFVRGRVIEDAARQEAMLVAQGHYFRGLIENSNDIILVTGRRGHLRYASPAFRRILGFRADAWHNKRMLSLVWPDDQRRALECFRECAARPGVMIPWKLRVCHAAGGFRWLDGSSTNQLDDPHIAGFVTNARDVTDSVNALEDLQLKDRAMATSLNAIVITDAEGKLVYVNPAFLRIWGYEREEDVLGRSALEFAEPERTAQTIGTLQTQGIWRGEIAGLRADGSTFEMLVAANLLLDDEGRLTHMMAACQDITDSKRLQSQFLQSQKMESVGRLAGGVAHDFNNMLTVINGYIEMALMEFPDTANFDVYLNEIQIASRSAASLTQQLLAFSRKQIIAPRVLDLNEVLAKVRPMLDRVIGEDVQLEMVFGSRLGHVQMDATQVEQIVLNLAVNARDAMPQGGKLVLETSNAELDESYAATNGGVEPGSYVMLAVTDNGAGMTEEVRKQLFEPFFTTKDSGKGTGLGLAMVYGAVKQNGGNVEVYSAPNEGTTFKLYWPCTSEPLQKDRPASRPTAPLGTETLVLVEDDPRVRKIASLMLKRQGYNVHTFSNGPEALEGVAVLDEPLHLLITDVIMPKMNGKILAEQMLSLRPNIKVLFASGYTADVIVHHGMIKDSVEVLAKPYTHAVLAQRVRDVLDGCD